MNLFTPLSVYFLLPLLSVKYSSANVKEEDSLEERALARTNIDSNLVLYGQFSIGRVLLSSLLSDRLIFIALEPIPQVYEVSRAALSNRSLSMEGVTPQPLETKFPALYDFPEFSQMISMRNWARLNVCSTALTLNNEETLIFVNSIEPSHFGAIAFSLTTNETSHKVYEYDGHGILPLGQSRLISSTEPNVFYNLQTLKLFDPEYGDQILDVLTRYSFDGTKFSETILRMCVLGDGTKTTIYFRPISESWGLRYDTWDDLWHYGGFTDTKHFYLFGRRNLVYIFEYPKIFAPYHRATRALVEMKDFFKVTESQLSPGSMPTTAITNSTDTPPQTTPYHFLTASRVDMLILVVACFGFAINCAIVIICHRNRFCIGRYFR